MITKIYEQIKNYIILNYKFLIFLALLIFTFYYEFPYIIYKSGGTINLENRIEVDKEYIEKGDISMSYVTAMKGTAPFILLSYILPDWDLFPLVDIAGEGNDYDDVLEVGKENLTEGIDNAIIAAFNESRYGIKIKDTINEIIYISEEAETDIKIGDILLEVNDTKVDKLEDVKEIINKLKEGDKVTLKVKNDNKEYLREAKVYKDVDDSLKIGIAFKTTYDYETEIPVSIKMKRNESGSSGSLMMSLAIYNALTETDITKGLNIVGTGAINSDGTVEEIGGVKYKVLAAVKKDADLFICPKENYEEALKIKKKRNLDIEIVGVNSLKEVIDYLENK